MKLCVNAHVKCECVIRGANMCMEIYVRVWKCENGIGPGIVNSGSNHVGLLHLAQVEA